VSVSVVGTDTDPRRHPDQISEGDPTLMDTPMVCTCFLVPVQRRFGSNFCRFPTDDGMWLGVAHWLAAGDVWTGRLRGF